MKNRITFLVIFGFLCCLMTSCFPDDNPAPVCAIPVDLSVSNITRNSATLSWTTGGGANFNIEYGVTGFARGSGTLITNTNSPHILNGLQPNTEYDFYVKKICSTTLESSWSSVKKFKTLCSLELPTVANQNFCTEINVSQIIVNSVPGATFKWYDSATSMQEITTISTTGVYYVSAHTTTCVSDRAIANISIANFTQPIAASPQFFCTDAQVANLMVQTEAGFTMNWYISSSSTDALPPNTPLINEATYYVSKTKDGCFSPRVAVRVVLSTKPAALQSQNLIYCNPLTFSQINLNPSPGLTLKWYRNLIDHQDITPSTSVTTGVFYVAQSNNGCESDRVAIDITVRETLNKPVAGTQNFCNSGTVNDLVAQGVSGATILWYSSLTAANPLANNTALVNGTYYVSQRFNDCESERRAVAIRVVNSVAPQVSPFTICGTGAVSDLHIPAANGVTYRWYASATSTTELAQTTPLVTGTYYVSKVQFDCESSRTAVAVNVGSRPVAPTGSENQSLVEGSKISNLAVNQPNVTWFATNNDSQTRTNPLSPNMPLVNGTTYYGVIIGTNGCSSLPLAVTVNVYLSNNEFKMEGLKYYPNPVSDILNVSYIDVLHNAEVYDINGKKVKSINTDSKTIQIDLSDLASGTYMIQLKTDSKQQFIKVLKK